MRGKFQKMIFFIVFAISLLLAPRGETEYYQYKTITAYVWNDILEGLVKRKITIFYDDSPDSYLIFFCGTQLSPDMFMLNKAQIESLNSLIAKYEEWNNKATNMRTKIEKDIGKINNVTIFCGWGDDVYTSTGNTLTIKFFSQTPEKHQLIIKYPKSESVQNEFISCGPVTLYFWWSNVMELKSALNPDSINVFIERTEKKKKIEEEFK